MQKEELELNVKPKEVFAFNPSNLKIKLVGFDFSTGMARVYYELKEVLSNEKYEWREWIDKGIVAVPASLFAMLVNENGAINEDVVAQFLNSFKLEYVKDEPKKEGEDEDTK